MDTALSDGYRPTVVERAAGAIAAADVVTKLWGDDQSGFATDLIYVSDQKIQQLIFELDPMARFTHSRRHRTIFGAHQVYRVLTGRFVLANPATGDLQQVEAGQYVHLPPGTWHHGFNQSVERLRVLEYFAPPPATGSSQPFARTQPYLDEARYAREEWLGRWPEAIAEARTANAIRVVRKSDLLWLAEGHYHPLIVAVAVSVPELTVCAAELLPGAAQRPPCSQRGASGLRDGGHPRPGSRAERRESQLSPAGHRRRLCRPAGDAVPLLQWRWGDRDLHLRSRRLFAGSGGRERAERCSTLRTAVECSKAPSRYRPRSSALAS